MLQRFFKELFIALLTCLGLLVIVFIVSRIIPIDPALAMVGDNASHEAYLSARQQLGLDCSYSQQFLHYLMQIMQGNFGYSLLTSNLVLNDIQQVLPATVELATVALFFGAIIGIPSGIIAAFYQNRWQDQILRAITLFGNSVSIFWLGLMGLIIFYAELNLFPAPGRLSISYALNKNLHGFILLPSIYHGDWLLFKDALWHILLPSLILAYYNLSHISRMVRLFIIEQLNQEYITTARIKGLNKWQVLLRHALPNIKIPLLTILILSYAGLLEGSSFVETIFMWPGLGGYLAKSLRLADSNATLAATLVIGLIFISFNLVADFLYKYLDPRTR